jgi:ribonuclease VapC
VTPGEFAVLDASALLAFLLYEPGRERVETALRLPAAISSVNLEEVLSKAAERGDDPAALARSLRREGILGSQLVAYAFDEALAVEVARLRPVTRPWGLSLGDRACLALGRALGVPVLTTEQTWRELRLDITVEVIR